MKSHLWRILFFALISISASCSGKNEEETGNENGANAPASETPLNVTAETAPQEAEASQSAITPAEPQPVRTEGTSANSEAPTNDPVVPTDEWSNEWRKETFAGKDPVKLWEQYSQAAQAELSKPGADPSDLQAKAKSLGPDAQKVFEFMRDQVTLDPYAGVLRGARGTLVAGAGNALDRALLAQAILKADGIESRLVAGKLSDSQADELLARFLDSGPVPQVLADLVATPDESALKEDAREMSATVGLPENSVSDLMQHAREKEQEFWARTDELRATQFAFLDGHLQRGGVTKEVDGTALSSKLKGRLREHYWLQIQEQDGTWSEFDPTFSDGVRGTTYGSDPVLLSEIPREKFHQLEFSLVYHTVADGAPEEEVLIAGTFPSADALFEPLEFRIQPTDLGVEPNALAAMDPKQKIEALRKMSRFEGILRAGSKVSGGRAFDLDGTTYDAAGQSSVGSGVSSFGGLGGAFGGGGETPPRFVELQVVLRLTGPDREPMSQTRTLVRAEDINAPTFAPPLLEWEMLLQPQWISAEFVGFRALNQTVATGNALMVVLSDGQSGATFEPPPHSPALLLQLAVLRQSAAAHILAKQDSIRALVDEPMLTIYGNRLTGIHDQVGQITAAKSVDIVENAVRYLPRNDSSRLAAFDAALRQGVADAALEATFLRETQPSTAGESAITVLQRAQNEGRPTLLITPLDADKLRSAGMAEADIEWIQVNEAPTARLAIATTADARNAWWSIRPDGNAILRTRGGRGSSTTEYDLEMIQIVLKVEAYLVCNLEVAHSMHEGHKARAAGQLVYCLVTGVGAASFWHMGLHNASWVLLGLETLVFFSGAPTP